MYTAGDTLNKRDTKMKTVPTFQEIGGHIDIDAYVLSFPHGSGSKVSSCNAGDVGSIPGSGRSSEEGNGNPLQYSCLENSMDRGAWWATVHGIAQNPAGLTQLSTHTQGQPITVN